MYKADREPQVPEEQLPDPTITGLARNNPVLLAKLLCLQDIKDFEDETGVWRQQAEADLVAVLAELKGSLKEPEIRYWMNPSAQPPGENAFDNLARATVHALAEQSPFFEAVHEVLPRQKLTATAPSETVETGDYL